MDQTAGRCLTRIDHARTQVLGFGTHAVALEPRELYETVLETAQAILKFHGVQPDSLIPSP